MPYPSKRKVEKVKQREEKMVESKGSKQQRSGNIKVMTQNQYNTCNSIAKKS